MPFEFARDEPALRQPLRRGASGRAGGRPSPARGVQSLGRRGQGRVDGARALAHRQARARADADRAHRQYSGCGLRRGMALAHSGQARSGRARGGNGHLRRDDSPRAARQRGHRESGFRGGRGERNSMGSEFFHTRDFGGVFLLLAGPGARASAKFIASCTKAARPGS